MTQELVPEFALEPSPRPVTLTAEQKQFHKWVRKIESLRAELAEWSGTLPQRTALLHAELTPMCVEYNRLRVELVRLLDRAYSDRRATRKERRKLRHLIPSITAELMQEQPDAEIRSIHDRYSDISFDEESEIAGDMAKSMVEALFDVSIGDDIDFNDPEQLRNVADEIARRQHEELEKQQPRSEARRTKRKKTARQIEKEQRLQAEAAQARKSLQEVYRKLAATLHPDRAPDDAERARRTGLMQRVNIAYEKKDLLQLLELQLEVERVDESVIETLPDERVKRYNRVLKEQCDELRAAIDEAQMPFRFQLGLSPFEALSPKLVIATLEQDVRNTRSAIDALRLDLPRLADLRELKRWLRDFKIPQAADIDGFIDSPF